MPSLLKSDFRRVMLSFATAFTLFSVGAAAVSHALTSSPSEVANVEQALSPNLIAMGRFEGRSNLNTSGEAYILKTRTSYALVLSDDFYLEPSASLVLGFGKSGEYIQATQFAELEKNTGRQTYRLPKTFKPGTFNQVYVWQESSSSPLSVATFTPPTNDIS